ncbi:MAG: hypothetical protein U0T77_01140 [Chitinophagales bacterium]
MNILSGKIKTLQVVDSISGLDYEYELYYNDLTGELISVKKNNTPYIDIYPVNDSTLGVNRLNDTSGVEYYEISYNNQRRVQSMKWIYNSAFKMDNYVFIYNTDKPDTIRELGIPPLKFDIVNYNFVFENNNCTSLVSTYQKSFLSGTIQETKNITYTYHNYVNNNSVPLQTILQNPDVYITTPVDVMSLAYIANLRGLTLGYSNRNLIKEREGIWHYDYLFDANGFVSKINWFDINNRNLLNKVYLIEYY